MKKSAAFFVGFLLVLLSVGVEIPLLFVAQKTIFCYNQLTEIAKSGSHIFVFSKEEFAIYQINDHEISYHGAYYDYHIVEENSETVTVRAHKDRIENIIAALSKNIQQEKNKKTDSLLYSFFAKVWIAPHQLIFAVCEKIAFQKVAVIPLSDILHPFIPLQKVPPQ